MKIELNEYEGLFQMRIAAETVEDAAKLARLSMNSTQKLDKIYSVTTKSGDFFTWINVNQKKNTKSCIE